MKIKELTIFTNNFSKQIEFYTNVLQLNILNNSKKSVLFKIGNSNLNFIKGTKHTTPYHFAFNIPANQEKEALAWLKERVKILKMDETEIQDFDDWNAKSIYFYDLDLNIVELISRKNLNNSSSKKFNQNSFLEISEIGLPTNNIKKEFDIINNKLRLPIYDGNFDNFCAVGTETGLFIIINKTIKKWFPVNDKAYSSDFKLKLLLNKETYELSYINQQITIISNNGID